MSDIQKISGRVIVVIPEISGTKGDKPWVKQQFAIETPGQYPKKVAFQCWNDKCDLIPKVGTEVTVSYNPESREYNDKWYTDLNVFNIEKLGSTQKSSKPQAKAEPVKTGLNIQAEEDEDLPF